MCMPGLYPAGHRRLKRKLDNENNHGYGDSKIPVPFDRTRNDVPFDGHRPKNKQRRENNCNVIAQEWRQQQVAGNEKQTEDGATGNDRGDSRQEPVGEAANEKNRGVDGHRQQV